MPLETYEIIMPLEACEIIMPLEACEIIMPLEACEIIMPLEAGDGFKFKFVCFYRKCPLLFVLLHHRYFQLFACW